MGLDRTSHEYWQKVHKEAYRIVMQRCEDMAHVLVDKNGLTANDVELNTGQTLQQVSSMATNGALAALATINPDEHMRIIRTYRDAAKKDMEQKLKQVS